MNQVLGIIIVTLLYGTSIVSFYGAIICSDCTIVLLLIGFAAGFIALIIPVKNNSKEIINKRDKSGMKKICLKVDDLDFENTDKIEFDKNREMMFLYPELSIEHYRTPQKEMIISSTVITYKSKSMGKTFRCISNKNAETLAFIIDQNGFISLYYDPNNLDNYFFDLNGNS